MLSLERPVAVESAERAPHCIQMEELTAAAGGEEGRAYSRDAHDGRRQGLPAVRRECGRRRSGLGSAMKRAGCGARRMLETAGVAMSGKRPMR
jgi:hypothetical protein